MAPIVGVFDARLGRCADMILFRAKNTAGAGHIEFMTDAAILGFVDCQAGSHRVAVG